MIIATLSDLRDNGFWLFADCENPRCGHAARLDLDALIGRLGGGHPYTEKSLTRRLVCPRCGRREPALVVAVSPQAQRRMNETWRDFVASGVRLAM